MPSDIHRIISELLKAIDYSHSIAWHHHIHAKTIYEELHQLQQLLLAYQLQEKVVIPTMKTLYVFLRHAKGSMISTWQEVLIALDIYLSSQKLYEVPPNRSLHYNEIQIMFQTPEGNLMIQAHELRLKNPSDISIIKIFHKTGLYTMHHQQLIMI